MDIETRSILSTMFYLDQGIKLPAWFGSGEIVNVSLANNVQTFDFGKIYDGLYELRSSQ